jgi:hypothetical protein
MDDCYFWDNGFGVLFTVIVGIGALWGLASIFFAIVM